MDTRYSASVTPIDLDVFRAAYLRNNELMNRGEIEAAFEWVPSDFVWYVLGDALPGQDRLEAPPVLRGREAVIEFFTEMAEAWAWRPKPE